MSTSYQERAVAPELRARALCIWTFEQHEVLDSRPILPDGCIDLVFDRRTGELDWVGAMSRTLWLGERATGEAFGIRFRPGGAVGVLGERADTLTDRSVSAETLGPWWRELTERVRDAGNIEDQIAVMSRQMIVRARRGAPVDARLVFAAESLSKTLPRSIDAIANDLGLSRQHCRRLFLEHVGLPPKVFARTLRATQAAAALREGQSVARAARDAGYADQSHLSRDFRKIIGMTASEFVERTPVRPSI